MAKPSKAWPSQTKAAIAARFPPPQEFHWRAGPYQAPAAKLGATLHDERSGDVTVAGFTEAPIPWPAAEYRQARGSPRCCRSSAAIWFGPSAKRTS